MTTRAQLPTNAKLVEKIEGVYDERAGDKFNGRRANITLYTAMQSFGYKSNYQQKSVSFIVVKSQGYPTFSHRYTGKNNLEKAMKNMQLIREKLFS